MYCRKAQLSSKQRWLINLQQPSANIWRKKRLAAQRRKYSAGESSSLAGRPSAALSAKA